MNILLVSPAWLGDFTMMQSLLITLQQKYPDAALDVLTPKNCLPLTEFMPQINRAVVIDTQHGKFDWHLRRQTAETLKNNRYDWALILPITWKSALVPYFANIKKRTGFLGEMRFGLLNDIIKLNERKTPLMVGRYLSLVGETKIHPPNFVSEALKQNVDDKNIALCPGAAYGPAKQWPIDYYRLLTQKLTENGYNINIFGSDKEHQAGDQIATNLARCQNFAGKLSLREAVIAMSECSIIICNDSGLMHIAAALNKKMVAIFGSSSTAHTPPLHDQAIIVEKTLDCRPCFAKTCRYRHYRCLTDISVDEVLMQVMQPLSH